MTSMQWVRALWFSPAPLRLSSFASFAVVLFDLGPCAPRPSRQYSCLTKRSNQMVKHPITPEPVADDTESRILDAAHAVFLRSGTAGARMQEIADEAGVNKALLHYYFRNKERLAGAVF